MTTRAEQQRLDRLNTWTCDAPGCTVTTASASTFPMSWWHIVQIQRCFPSAWLCSWACAVRWLAEQEHMQGGSHD